MTERRIALPTSESEQSSLRATRISLLTTSRSFRRMASLRVDRALFLFSRADIQLSFVLVSVLRDFLLALLLDFFSFFASGFGSSTAYFTSKDFRAA